MRPGGLELSIAGGTVLLSTLSFLLGSNSLTVLSLVGGGISFGLTLGIRMAGVGLAAGHSEKRERRDSNPRPPA